MFKITRYYSDRKFTNFYATTEQLEQAVKHLVECHGSPGDVLKKFEVDFFPVGNDVPVPIGVSNVKDLI